ncbi:hypothetical protein OF83DRAFT_450116 [Amylostereum chailletii]|nr:hypothetical protein OF83DRAFT_450116 [Amylostereum chailletii]
MPPHPSVNDKMSRLSLSKENIDIHSRSRAPVQPEGETPVDELHDKEGHPIPSLIARFPVELLEDIFCYIPLYWNSKDEYHHEPVGWLAIPHVCRLWRDITLNCPDYWTTMPIMLSSRWVEEAMVRSKSAPITICARFGKPQDGETTPRNVTTLPNWNATRTALFRLDRARELVLDTTVLDQKHFIPKYRRGGVRVRPDLSPIELLSRQAAPELEKLHLDLPPSYGYSSLNGIFAGKTPSKLRSIHLGHGFLSRSGTSTLCPVSRSFRCCDISNCAEISTPGIRPLPTRYTQSNSPS